MTTPPDQHGGPPSTRPDAESPSPVDDQSDQPAPEDTGVRATRFRLGSEQFAILSVPLPTVESDAPSVPLTDAEQDVCEHLLRGKSNAEIAGARGVSVRTVANQVAAIFEKYGVHSRSELLARLARAEPEQAT